jgi:hypothetical protein
MAVCMAPAPVWQPLNMHPSSCHHVHVCLTTCHIAYCEADIGCCPAGVWNHVYPGESAPPLPVTGICLSGEGSQYQDSYQQQQQQCGVLGAWSTTTFRPSLAHGHSLWDHDGTDFSSGYTTQVCTLAGGSCTCALSWTSRTAVVAVAHPCSGLRGWQQATPYADGACGSMALGRALQQQ